jgi:hypothetical protein
MGDGAQSMLGNKVNSRKQVASRLLDSISESLTLDPDTLARVAGQFITPNGNQVYPVQINGKAVFVTIPED